MSSVIQLDCFREIRAEKSVVLDHRRRKIRLEHGVIPKRFVDADELDLIGTRFYRARFILGKSCGTEH